MRKFLVASILWLAIVPAHADLGEWSVEVDEDPFSGGKKITIDYLSNFRSGVFIFCDSAEQGLRVRAVPGFAMPPALGGFKPRMQFAFDGIMLSGADGVVAAVGDNIAAAETTLTRDQARQFARAFSDARKQVAIKDGISDQPYLLKAKGSTTAGKQLVQCLERQAPS